MGNHMDHESPIACNITALSPQQRQRRATLAGQLKQAVQAIHELSDGYAMRFHRDESAWMAAAEFVTIECQCCPFLAFSLEVESQGAPIWLRLVGREGVKEFLRAEFGLGKLAR
jgi:hypothetical protein